jgi:hypothetical protein
MNSKRAEFGILIACSILTAIGLSHPTMMALSSHVVNDQADGLNPHSRRSPMTALPLYINASITSKKMFI